VLSNGMRRFKMKKFITLLAGLCLLLSFSFAQETGKLGLNMRVEPSFQIGITYHISKLFALRPSLGFSKESLESETEIPGKKDQPARTGKKEEDRTFLNFGLGFLFCLYSREDFSAYTGLHLGYAHESGEVSISGRRERDLEDTGDIWRGNALLGLQCMVTKNLGIFGEVGAGYSQGEFNRANVREAKRTQKRWGLMNSGVGLVFYF